MTNSKILFLALLIKAGTISADVNLWTSHGPGGGSIRALVIDPKNPDVVYVSAEGGGVFRSTDGGASWNPANSGLTGYGFNLSIDPLNPRNLYAWNAGLFKSTDNGLSWHVLNSPGYVSFVVVDGHTPDTVYAVTSSGVFKSTDGGASWSPANSGLPSRGVGALVLDSRSSATVYAAVYGQNGGGGAVFRSVDGGASWTLPLQQTLVELAGATSLTCDEWGYFFARATGRDAPPPEDFCLVDGDRAVRIAIDQYMADLQTFAVRSPNAPVYGLIAGPRSLLADPQNAGTIYAVTSRGIFKSTDGTVSWNWASSGFGSQSSYSYLDIRVLAADPGNPGTLYAGMETGFGPRLYKSTDGAVSWNQVAGALPGNSIVNAFAVDPNVPGTFYAGTTSGVYKSTDAASSWNPENAGLGDSFVGTLVLDPQHRGTLYAAANGGSPGLFKSTDGATTWTAIGPPATPPSFAVILAIDPQNPSTLYAAGSCCGPARPVLFKSSDAGATWQQTGLAQVPLTVIVDPQTTSTLYARSGLVGGGIIKSIDGGNSWTSINSGLGGAPNNVPNIYPLVIDPQSPNTLYAVRYSDGRMFRTTNGGASWDAVNTGWDAGLFHVTVLVADPQNSGTLYAATGEFDCGYGDTCPPDYYEKVAATSGAGLFRTTDGGQHWTRLQGPSMQPGSLSAVYGLAVLAVDPANSNTLYTATGYPSRVFRSTDAGASWSELSAGLTAIQITVLAVDGQTPNTVYAATLGGGVFAITLPSQ